MDPALTSDAPDPGLRVRLQSDLRSAMLARDPVATSALRGALAAIANAEAVDAPAARPSPDGPIAGAVAGVGAAEVVRRTLTDADVVGLVRAEIDQHLAAAAQFESLGATDRATRARQEARVLTPLLDALGPPSGLK